MESVGGPWITQSVLANAGFQTDEAVKKATTHQVPLGLMTRHPGTPERTHPTQGVAQRQMKQQPTVGAAEMSARRDRHYDGSSEMGEVTRQLSFVCFLEPRRPEPCLRITLFGSQQQSPRQFRSSLDAGAGQNARSRMVLRCGVLSGWRSVPVFGDGCTPRAGWLQNSGFLIFSSRAKVGRDRPGPRESQIQRKFVGVSLETGRSGGGDSRGAQLVSDRPLRRQRQAGGPWRAGSWEAGEAASIRGTLAQRMQVREQLADPEIESVTLLRRR